MHNKLIGDSTEVVVKNNRLSFSFALVAVLIITAIITNITIGSLRKRNACRR
jgi:hypothetical protein